MRPTTWDFSCTHIRATISTGTATSILFNNPSLVSSIVLGILTRSFQHRRELASTSAPAFSSESALASALTSASASALATVMAFSGSSSRKGLRFSLLFFRGDGEVVSQLPDRTAGLACCSCRDSLLLFRLFAGISGCVLSVDAEVTAGFRSCFAFGLAILRHHRTNLE